MEHGKSDYRRRREGDEQGSEREREREGRERGGREALETHGSGPGESFITR